MATITYTPIPIVLLGQSGGAVSTATTSPAILVQDYNTISLSIVSSTGSASIYSVQAANDDGIQPIGGPYGTVASLNWNTISGLTAGQWTVAPGMRWLRVIRAAIDVSSSSNVTVVLAGNAF